MKTPLIVLLLFLSSFLLMSDVYEEFEQKILDAKGIKRVDLLINFSIEYQRDEDYKKAETKAQTALIYAKQINYIKGIALAQNNIGRILYIQQNYKEAINFSNLSLKNMNIINNKFEIANNLKLLGMCYYRLNNNTKASFFFNDAIKFYKKRNIKNEIANIQSLLGDVSHNIGEMEKALNYYLTALKGFEKLKDNDGISNTLISIGAIYSSIKKYTKAEETLLRAYKISKKSKDKQIMIDALSILGDVYQNTNNYSKALKQYKMAYKLVQQEKDRYQMAAIINNIGEIHRLKKDYSDALISYQDAYDIFKELDYALGTVTCSLNIGLVYLNKESPDLAIPFFNESLNIAKSIEAKSLIRDIYEGYSGAYALLKKYQLALKYHILFTTVKDELFTEKSSRNMAEMQTKYETEKKENTIKLLSKDKDLDKVIKNSLFIVLGLLFILAFLIFNRYRLKARAHKALTDAHCKLELASEEITEQNEKILSSIRYAQRIQNAILPLEDKLSEAFPENFLIFLPKDIVSGDFYWFSQIDDIKFITVVDCTGHGVPGAFMSMIGNSLLNQIINEQRITDPAIILDQLSLQVKQALKQEKGEGKTRDGMDMCFIKIEPENNSDDPDSVKITYVGAKRSLFIVKKSKIGKDNELIEIKGDRKSIGGFQKKVKAPFKNNELLLTRGDSIYMTSDGFVDQHNLEEKKLGSKKLRSLLTKIASEKVEKQKNILQKALNDHKKDAEQQDDITILGIKF